MRGWPRRARRARRSDFDAFLRRGTRVARYGRSATALLVVLIFNARVSGFLGNRGSNFTSFLLHICYDQRLSIYNHDRVLESLHKILRRIRPFS